MYGLAIESFCEVHGGFRLLPSDGGAGHWCRSYRSRVLLEEPHGDIVELAVRWFDELADGGFCQALGVRS